MPPPPQPREPGGGSESGWDRHGRGARLGGAAEEQEARDHEDGVEGEGAEEGRVGQQVEPAGERIWSRIGRRCGLQLACRSQVRRARSRGRRRRDGTGWAWRP